MQAIGRLEGREGREVHGPGAEGGQVGRRRQGRRERREAGRYEVRELTRMGVRLVEIVWCPPGEPPIKVCEMVPERVGAAGRGAGRVPGGRPGRRGLSGLVTIRVPATH